MAMKLIKPQREQFKLDVDRLQKVASGEVDGRAVGHTILACWKIHAYNNLFTNSYIDVYIGRRRELKLYWLDLLSEIVDIEFFFKEEQDYIYFPTTNNFFFFYFKIDHRVQFFHYDDMNSEKKRGRPRNEDIEPIIDNSWYE